MFPECPRGLKSQSILIWKFQSSLQCWGLARHLSNLPFGHNYDGFFYWPTGKCRRRGKWTNPGRCRAVLIFPYWCTLGCGASKELCSTLDNMCRYHNEPECYSHRLFRDFWKHQVYWLNMEDCLVAMSIQWLQNFTRNWTGTSVQIKSSDFTLTFQSICLFKVIQKVLNPSTAR